jgi:hypothetical protein
MPDEKVLNVRMPAAALDAITAAATQDGKKTADYVRIATLTAVCCSRRRRPLPVFIAAGESVSVERARDLGMQPVADLGARWQGEVRVPIGRNGLFHDNAGGVWLLTPDGLKQILGFDAAEERSRLALRGRSQ